jgi:molybdenum cofactor cytidylyltransferase
MQAECQAALLALGDQPLIQVEVVRRVLAAQHLNTIVIPSFQRKRGHPILINRALWPAVLQLPPGSNLREMINAHADRIHYVEVDTDTIIRDLDTPEDYRQATGQ